MNTPKSRYDLQKMTIDELVELANKHSSLNKFKENLVDYLVEVFDLSEAKMLFESLCGNYGLKKSDWGKPFRIRTKIFRITGFNPHKPKNCLNITDQNNKTFICSERYVKTYLK